MERIPRVRKHMGTGHESHKLPTAPGKMASRGSGKDVRN
jgi:hypothetical protein